jgi:hypothetical protein
MRDDSRHLPESRHLTGLHKAVLRLSEDDLGALAFLDLTLKVLIGLAKVGRPLSHLMFEAIICLYQRTSGRGLGC